MIESQTKRDYFLKIQGTTTQAKNTFSHSIKSSGFSGKNPLIFYKKIFKERRNCETRQNNSSVCGLKAENAFMLQFHLIHPFLQKKKKKNVFRDLFPHQFCQLFVLRKKIMKAFSGVKCFFLFLKCCMRQWGFDKQ